jgi:hypothetical protein
MAAEAPSAQIGRAAVRSRWTLHTPERTTQTASRSVIALKNRMGHQVDADEEAGRLMVVNFFPAATTPLPRHIGETGL